MKQSDTPRNTRTDPSRSAVRRPEWTEPPSSIEAARQAADRRRDRKRRRRRRKILAVGILTAGILLLVLVWAGLPQLTAQGINLLMILPVGLLGLYFHRKNGLTDGRAAVPLLLGGLPSVLLGVLLGNRMGEDTLRTCFGVLVLLLAVRELWLGFQALRREGWRLTARQNKKDADDEP